MLIIALDVTVQNIYYLCNEYKYFLDNLYSYLYEKWGYT